MRTYSVAVLCGPTLVNRLATWLHDFPTNATEGAEHVCFKVDAPDVLAARFAALDVVKQFSDTFSLCDISVTKGTYSVAVWCGPTLVNRLATWLHDFPMNVTEGTERVYFKVDASGALEARFAALDIIKQFSDTFSLRDISATEGAA